MMSKVLIEEFKKSLETGFIDKESFSEILYQPELLTNHKKPPKKVLSSIIQELNRCEEFFISVAFVTTSGIATLINTFKLLEKKGIQGKILVSQYLNFTQPEALKKLLKFKNIELRIATKENSHSKGYIFKTSEYYNLIIGSSNLTASALSTNKEWNLKVSALHSSSIVEKVLNEFDFDFNQGITVTEEFIIDYEKTYKKQMLFNKEHHEKQYQSSLAKIEPNSMQQEALINLKRLRKEGKSKALLISATGTGKTYLSAFDAKEFGAKKLLFVVHRGTIAKKSKKAFQDIFAGKKTVGLYSGNSRELDKDFVFSTIQTISKQTHLNQFEKDHFDYIIIDESHRSGAESYKRLINYFTPKFLLGMTATPERTDGNDIFSLFDHNIAYEIRLHRAMEEEMLSQFHYYGVSDLIIDEEIRDDTRDFNKLISNERVDKIINNADFYGSDNGITRGLIFCSRKKEAEELSEKFNEKGLRTIALLGNSSNDERERAIERLESNNFDEKLDYIFTVDIFNEGVDIPKINQIIMIRPTESAIIFVQQLGRGLRKIEGKGYLTVIDFIGNYKNNYLIPIALYGDTSYNKDSLRKMLSGGSQMIPGASTINFDEITKEKIFKSIDSATMKLLVDLRKDYNLLKYKLGRRPMMMDFIEHGSRDPFLYVEYSKSYLNFVRKVDKEFEPIISNESLRLLELFSREINNAKRVEESIILLNLIQYGSFNAEKLKESIKTAYGYTLSNETVRSCVANINFEFIRENKKVIYLENNSLKFQPEFLVILENPVFKNFLLDSINYSIQTFENNFKKEYYEDGLILYNKYSRRDVCRLLNWDKDISSTLYGYRTRNNVTPCFVTYHKSDEIDQTINYNDYFIDPSTFAWESRSRRKVDSTEIKNVINSERILLFIKKEDAEGTDFYFMGDVSIISNSIQQDFMPESKLPVVHFKFHLNHPVIDSVYHYLKETYNVPQQSLTPKIELLESPESLRNVEPIPSENLIPLYDFYAAAGSFSEMQNHHNHAFIDVSDKYKSENGYFACKVIGDSMDRRIPNGAICLFKEYSGGSRNGNIVLVENYGGTDPDFNSAFTIKTYSSTKTINEDGWQHSSIVLRPNSHDKNYKEIILNEESSPEMRIVGIFVKVLK